MVLLNDFKAQWEIVRSDVLGATEKVGSSGWYILGQSVASFESALAGYARLSGAVGCANGLDGLEIALRALGLKPGGKVLTTPLSAFATTLAIVRAGGIPVFVDVDERGNLDLDLAEQALAADRSLQFFVPVHLYGAPLDLDRLASLRDRFQLQIVEDCAQSLGAAWDSRPVGSVGQLAATSFYPTKNLGAMGDGGAILGNDQELLAICRQLRDYGQTAKYRHEILGLNSRLDELQAAILETAFLPRLGEWTERRREIAQRYLSELPGLKLDARAHSVWHLYPTLVEDRSAVMERLKAAGVQTGIHYPGLISAQGALTEIEFKVVGELKQAQRFAEQEMSLPIHPFLSDAQVDQVIGAVKNCLPFR